MILSLYYYIKTCIFAFLVSPAIASCPYKTTSGKYCSIPFTYKGVTYYSCTTADHNKPWCSLDLVYKGNWGDCGESLIDLSKASLHCL